MGWRRTGVKCLPQPMMNQLVHWHIWDTGGLFYQYGLTLTPAWISNHMRSKVWAEVTYPFPNFNGCTVEVWEGISNFIWLIICKRWYEIGHRYFQRIHWDERNWLTSVGVTSRLIFFYLIPYGWIICFYLLQPPPEAILCIISMYKWYMYICIYFRWVIDWPCSHSRVTVSATIFIVVAVETRVNVYINQLADVGATASIKKNHGFQLRLLHSFWLGVENRRCLLYQVWFRS